MRIGSMGGRLERRRSARAVFGTSPDGLKILPIRHGRIDAATPMPEVDGLKSLAILFVLVWHASLRAERYLDAVNTSSGQAPHLYGYFPHGEIGVALFFAISGLLVSHPLLRHRRGEWVFLRFYKRRIIRIYPPYLVTMLLCWIALAAVGYTPSDAYGFQQNSIDLNSSLAASLTFTHAMIFDGPPRMNPPMWSVEVEVSFYIIVPLISWIYLSLEGVTARMAVLLAVTGLTILLFSLAAPLSDVDIRGRWALAYHMPLFLVGFAAAALEVRAGLHERHRRYDGVFVVGLCGLLWSGLLLTATDSRMLNWPHAVMVQLLTLTSVAAMLVGALKGRAVLRLLAHPWVGLTGVMCYSVYLTHIVTMTIVTNFIRSYVRPASTTSTYSLFLICNVAASLIVGSLFYVVVERRFAVPRPSKMYLSRSSIAIVKTD